MRVRTGYVLAGVIALGCGVFAQSREWPTYGHDPGGMRFSPLTQITPANVSQLEVAWVYHMKPAAAPRRPRRAGRPRSRTRRSGFTRARSRRSSSTG